MPRERSVFSELWRFRSARAPHLDIVQPHSRLARFHFGEVEVQVEAGYTVEDKRKRGSLKERTGTGYNILQLHRGAGTFCREIAGWLG